MPRTTHGIEYPDEFSPYPSRIWWKTLAEALDPFVGKLTNLPDLGGLMDLLSNKIDKPTNPLTGQVLTWNGDEWVAFDSTGSGGTGGTGTGLPMSSRGSLLIGTGTDWIVLPGGKNAGESLIVDPTLGYGYRWGSPLPPPGKGKMIAATDTGWIEVPASPKAGLALVADPTQQNGVRWGSELPTPSKGSVLVADGTKWLPLPWSGKDGEALIVDNLSAAGVKWGGVLPSPLKGALLVGDGVTWRLVTPPASEGVLVSDPSAAMGIRWSTDYIKQSDLNAYQLKSDMGLYALKSELAKLIADAMKNRWSGWASCSISSGWSGSLYANHDGTQMVLRGTVRPTSTNSSSTIGTLPSSFPSVYSEGITTHVTIKDVAGEYTGVVRPMYTSISGKTISTGGSISNLDRTYGVRFSSTLFMVV